MIYPIYLQINTPEYCERNVKFLHNILRLTSQSVIMKHI